VGQQISRRENARPFGNDLLRGSLPDVLQAAQSRGAAEVALAATRADVVRDLVKSAAPAAIGPRGQRNPLALARRSGRACNLAFPPRNFYGHLSMANTPPARKAPYFNRLLA
jgi:hypothetical protein